MTNGGFAALAVAFRAILEPGDEVVFLSPPWFFYELLILAAGGDRRSAWRCRRPRSTSTSTRSSAAITPRTRAVLVNTPHNPSGRVYPDRGPAPARRRARRRERSPRPPDLPRLRRAVQPDRVRRPDVPQPGRGLSGTRSSTYSYGKTLLAPGHADRLPDGAADDARPRGAPRAGARRPAGDRVRVPERAAPARDRGSRRAVDRRRRARAPPRPAGPGAARAWATRRRSRRARSTSWRRARSTTTSRSPSCSPSRASSSCPGTIVEVPGWFRISLTATDEMVERGLGGFARARERALATAGAAGR